MTKTSDIIGRCRTMAGRLKSSAVYDVPIVFGVSAVFLVLFNLVIGQDMNWDTRNYHFAAVFRWLHRDWQIDVAPSQLQTWFNPVVYVPSYWLINGLPPVVASLIISLVQALNGPLVFAIAHQLLVGSTPGMRRLQALACVGMAITGSAFLSEVGTTIIDSTLAIPMLIAILLVLREPPRSETASDSPSPQTWAIAGFLVGACVGLKLTFIVFAPAFLLAAGWFASRNWLSAMVLVGLGLAAGSMLTGGWWWALMWQRVGNPLFPIANNLFRSPLVGSDLLTDTRFIGRNWFDLASYAARMAIGGGPVSPGAQRFIGAEVHFRDLRYLAGLTCSVVLLWRAAIATCQKKVSRDALSFVAIFWLVSYIAWFYLFGIIRYIVLLEALGGMIALAAMTQILRYRGKILSYAQLAIAPCLIFSTYPATFGHEPFAGSWFNLGDVSILSAPHTTVVITTGDAVAYVQPYLPPSVSFVRIAGNLPIRREHGLGSHAAELIDSSEGPLRSLREAWSSDDVHALAHFGLRTVRGTCRTISAKAVPLTSCLLVRMGTHHTQVSHEKPVS